MEAAAYHDTTFEQNPEAFRGAMAAYASRTTANSCSLNDGGACRIGMAGPTVANNAAAPVNKGPDLDLS